MVSNPIPSTALILRRGRQIFLVQRPPAARFMGGFHTFVGGKLDATDHESEHSAGIWVEPEQALEQWDAGRLTLPPPMVVPSATPSDNSKISFSIASGARTSYCGAPPRVLDPSENSCAILMMMFPRQPDPTPT